MFRTRLVAIAIAAASGLGALAGCTAGHPTPGAAGSPSPGPSGPDSSVGDLPAPSGTPATSAHPTPTSLPSDADAYARLAVAAWRSHDAGALNNLNAPSDTVFHSLDLGNYDKRFDTLATCEGAAGSTYCTYFNTVGDTLRLQLRNELLGKPHAIVGGTLIPITFPTDFQAYAKEALDAWQAHNSAAVALLTGKPADTAFAAVPAALRTSAFTFTGTDGAAGHGYITFSDSAGDQVSFEFNNPGLVSPPANRHGLIQRVLYTPHP
jgi:hypothetical protein